MANPSIADIIEIRVGIGRPVSPEWGPDNASTNWRETEWRVFGDSELVPYGGAWEGERGSLKLDVYPYDEVCVMLTGQVALVDAEGGRRVFRGGDAFFVPKGFSGVWETIEPSTKVFVALPR